MSSSAFSTRSLALGAGMAARTHSAIRSFNSSVSTQQNAARAGEQITSRNLDVQPTVTVRPGWPLRAIIHKDIVLKPWEG